MNQPQNQNSAIVDRDIITPWYREPWAWFIAGIIAVSICWGSFLLYISISHADSVVVDDYYKVGKAINQDLRRDQRAAALQLKAVVALNNDANRIQVEMSGTLAEWPKQLRLHLMPLAQNSEKQTIALIQTPFNQQIYTGTTASISEGAHYIQLETLDQMVPEQGYTSGWRINNKTLISQSHPAGLSAHY